MSYIVVPPEHLDSKRLPHTSQLSLIFFSPFSILHPALTISQKGQALCSPVIVADCQKLNDKALELYY